MAHGRVCATTLLVIAFWATIAAATVARAHAHPQRWSVRLHMDAAHVDEDAEAIVAGASTAAEARRAWLRRAGDAGWPALCFVLGGPFGHAASVKERADDSVRLSKMVLNHQVAHVVLLEQLYRAWTILRGEPYHH